MTAKLGTETNRSDERAAKATTFDESERQESAGLTAEHIADRQQYRSLRQLAFFCVLFLVFTLATLLVAWIASFGVRLFYGGFKIENSSAALVLTPMLVTAALCMLPLLVMLRLVFHQESDKIRREKWRERAATADQGSGRRREGIPGSHKGVRLIPAHRSSHRKADAARKEQRHHTPRATSSAKNAAVETPSIAAP